MGFLHKLFGAIEFFVALAAVAVMVYFFVMQPHLVNGDSMYPNFHSGELILTEKVSYHFNEPQRGEIVVFNAPPTAHCPVGANCDFVKRVIAVPGERVKISDGLVHINGLLLHEPYLQSINFHTEGSNVPQSFLPEGIEQTVPTGSYLVMGDNRPGSSDSRDFGPIEKKMIIGKMLMRVWPFNVAGIPAFGKARLGN